VAGDDMSSTQVFPSITAAAGAVQKESTVAFDLKMRSSWGQALPLRVRSDFNINDVRQEFMKKYAWAPKHFRLLLNGQEPRLELTLRDLGIAETSVLQMQPDCPSPVENESIYRELSHLLYESKKSESPWRCTKATAGVARSGLLQSMHDTNKGVSDFSDFLKQRMGEVSQFSSDWSKFNQALRRYEKSVKTIDLDSISHAAPADVGSDSYIRSLNTVSTSVEHCRPKRVSASPLKGVSVHRSSKSKPDQSACIDREKLLKEARDHQYLIKTDFMHKAQAQFLQLQYENLQKIIVEKGPLEVDPAKSLRRMEIACTLPWDESLHRGYRENPDWLRQQRQTTDLPCEVPFAKSKVAAEQPPRAVVTVTFDIQEDAKPDPVIASVSPPKRTLQRTAHICDPALNRHAMNDAASLFAKYAASTGSIDFRPPASNSNLKLPQPCNLEHTVHTSPSDRALGIRTPTLRNVTKRGLSKDWRER
jgi:hypothetical protein